MRITYFVPVFGDAAVAQRVRILRAGGADLNLLGFRRIPEPVSQVEGIPAIDFGQTFEQRFWHRTFNVFVAALKAGRWRDLVRGSDVLLARNLEMWLIADAARSWAGARVPIVYECLDVHNLLSGHGIPSKLLRRLERRALQKSKALVVSSPGFLTNHFERLGVKLPPVIMAENKRFLPEIDDRGQDDGRVAGPPWRIGWFGVLRCEESFQILLAAARRHPELIDVELRGRPTEKLQDLINQHLPIPNMRFGGPYTTSDLATLYRGCHLTWAIDYSERGLNSDWLLPNRLYEGGYFNNPAIALAGTETANWLHARGVGILLENPAVDLDGFLSTLTATRYDDLRRASARIPLTDLIYTTDECRRLVTSLTATNRQNPPA